MPKRSEERTEDESPAEHAEPAKAGEEQGLAPEEPCQPEDQPEDPPLPDQDAEGELRPTLLALDPTRRPKHATACATCPNSVWWSTDASLTCYCRVMFVIVWSDKDPRQIRNCDGTLIGRKEEAAEEDEAS